MPISVEKWKTLQKARAQAEQLFVTCQCGARNIRSSLKCVRCGRFFRAMKCPFFTNHMTNKFGRCKRFGTCPPEKRMRCPAVGEA